MAKLCAKGKAAAKRKFKKYPSAYANMHQVFVLEELSPVARKRNNG